MFIELFGACNGKVSKSMLICKNVASRGILDNGWGFKEAKSIHCAIVMDNVLAKYMIAIQTLYFSFCYRRSWMINGVLVPMDQEVASLPLARVINIEVLDEECSLLTLVAIRETCGLSNL